MSLTIAIDVGGIHIRPAAYEPDSAIGYLDDIVSIEVALGDRTGQLGALALAGRALAGKAASKG